MRFKANVHVVCKGFILKTNRYQNLIHSALFGIYCIPYLVWHIDILQYMYNLLSFFFLWKNRRNERAPEGGFLFGEQGDRKCRARDRMCDKPLKQWVTLPGACAEHWTCKSRGLRRRRGVERVEEVSKESEVEEPTQQKKAKVGGVQRELLNVFILVTAFIISV